ncbi:MAG: peptidylprolyl isomerase [Verrucomicrobiota bacterium]|nr:peptidylprolyl isomerase [Verrucomicrobiota bacterium]
MNSGRYFKVDPTNGALASLFIHRSVTNFVIQSGGYIGTVYPSVPTVLQGTAVAPFPPVKNEPFISNRRGTIAMAKVGGDPNSATSQWFINLADNSGGSAALDTQNGGFTVFGRVAGSGMAVADAIAAVPKYLFGTIGGPFNSLPLLGYSQNDYNNNKPVRVSNVISIPEFTQIPPLQFSVTSSDPTVATAAVSGTRLLVRAAKLGSAQITVTATDLDGATVSQSFAVTAIGAPGRILNISTRANFPLGNEALTAGFIVNGGPSNQVVVRAVSSTAGVENPLHDLALEVFNAQGQLIASNDTGAILRTRSCSRTFRSRRKTRVNPPSS